MFEKLLTVKPEDGRFVYLLKSLINRFNDHNISQIGGQLAFFVLLSTFPFLIFLNALIGSFHITTQMVEEFLTPIFPEQIVGLIGSYVEYISTNQSASLLSVGILVTIFSASKAVRALSRALNTAYGVKDNRNFFFQLIFSMAFILVLGFVIIIMIVLVAFSSDVVERMASAMKISFALVNVVSVWRWVTLVVVMFFALCMMYKFAPHKKLRFKEIIPGTIFSMAGFMLLTVGFSIYVTYFMRGSALYGTIGTVILLMLWMYIVGMILIVGAEINSAISIMPRKRKN